jgi:predicted RNase H-like nuclease (RuvC/YqgF family)
MVKEKKDDGGDLLVESEARFREALGRLAKALVGQKDAAIRVQRLETENEILETGLNQLKKDYATMDNSMADLRAKYEELASVDEDAEKVALQRALDALQTDHDTLEHSFTMLKAQYLDLQQSGDSESQGGGAAAQATTAIGAHQFKVSFTRQLDGTIDRIEKLIDAANG